MDTSKNLRESLNWFLSSKSMILDIEGSWRVEMFSRLLTNNFKNMNIENHKLMSKTISAKKFNLQDLNSLVRPFFNELIDYTNEHLNQYLDSFIIHGSYSDQSYKIGWSDLDTFIVVNADTCLNYDKLIKLRKHLLYLSKILYKIDALCHHEFIIYSTFDIKNYKNFMPIEALKNAKYILNNSKELEFKITKQDINQAKQNFINRCQVILDFCENGLLKHHRYKGKFLNKNIRKYPNRMYQLKYLLSNIMTLPAYYLEAKGYPCYKGDSFNLCKNDFINNWTIVDKCSNIRDKWDSKEKFPFLNNKISNWIIDTLDINYHNELRDLTTKMLIKLEHDE